jgi:hypothetical protein
MIVKVDSNDWAVWRFCTQIAIRGMPGGGYHGMRQKGVCRQ